MSPSDPSYPAVAALLALSVGAVLLVAGVLRLGFLVNFLSHLVISGFTSAAAITIALSQGKDLLGVDIGRPDGVIATVSELGSQLASTNSWTVAIGLAATSVLALGKRFAPKAPTALVVFASSTLLSRALSLTDKGVAVLGQVPTGLPTPTMVEMDTSLVGDLAPVALAIAIFRTRRVDAAALAVTFIATLLIGVEPGLAIGLVFSLVMVLHNAANPHTTELGRVEGTSEYRNVNRWSTTTSDRCALLRVDGHLFFANTKFLEDGIAALVADRPDVATVIIDASAIGGLDTNGAHLLRELDADLALAGVTLRLTTVRGPVRDVMHRAGIWDQMADRIHPSIPAAEPDSQLLHPSGDERPTAVV